MKRFLGAAIFALLAVGCTPPQVEKTGPLRLEQRSDGLTYPIGSNEPFTGTFVSINKDGTIHEEQTYLKGVKHGHWQLFAENGVPKRRFEYVNGEIVREMGWHPNGQLKCDEGMKNGQSCGTSTFWFPDGRIRKIVHLLEGHRLHGQVIEFGESGEVLLDAIFYDGKLMEERTPSRSEPAKASDGKDVAKTAAPPRATVEP